MDVTSAPILRTLFLTVGVFLLLGGPALLYLLWYLRGRDKPVPLIAEYLPEPPDDIRPGMLGVLLDEKADMQDMLATVVDLARRGAITLAGPPLTYRRTPNQVALLPFEQALVEALFQTDQAVQLGEVRRRFSANFAAVKQALYAELLRTGYLAQNPERVRNNYWKIGGLGIIAGLVLAGGLLVAFAHLTLLGLLPGLALSLVSFGLLWLAHHLPRKTEHGAETAARGRAFKTYLRQIEQYTQLEQQAVIWDRWLPYAIAFGIEKEYIRKFEQINAPVPAWYSPQPVVVIDSQPYDPTYSNWHQPGGYMPTTATEAAHPPVENRADTPTPTQSPAQPAESEKSSGASLSDLSRSASYGLSDLSLGLGLLLSETSNALTGEAPAPASPLAENPSDPQPTASDSGSGWFDWGSNPNSDNADNTTTGSATESQSTESSGGGWFDWGSSSDSSSDSGWGGDSGSDSGGDSGGGDS